MNHTLPAWMERLLGIESAPGEGTVWTLEGCWNWPPWATLLFVVFAVGFVMAAYLRENRRAWWGFRLGLAAVRLTLVAIVLFMLGQFALSLQKTGLPYVVVLVDDSLSMTVVDVYDDELQSRLLERLRGVKADETTRWNLAKTLLLERDGALLDGIRRHYKLRLYYLTGARVSNSLEADELLEEINRLEPSGETTRLGEGLRAVLNDLRGSPPAAIVLLSDGVNTDGPPLAEAVEYARRKGVPLFTIGLGDDRPVRDLKLTDLLVEEVVFVDDVVYFEFKLTGQGFEGREARIVLREADSSKVLAEMTAVVAADGVAQPLRLPFKPTAEGEFQFVVEARPFDEERQTDNNRLQRPVDVRNEKIRVLLVQAYPSYEFRYLKRMLARDTTIELNYVLQDADLEHAEQAAGALKGFPIRREELFEYDVVILGDADPRLFNESMKQNLIDFVEAPEKGGTLICIAGPKFMPAAYRDEPLGRLLPIDLAAVRYPPAGQPLTEPLVIRPTRYGLDSPPMQLGETPAETGLVWDNLPPVYWMVDVQRTKRGARVLAENPGRLDASGQPLPVILMQYVGSGKVLFHATDETWRWRWRVGDVFFARYWVQTIRYLCRSKLSDSGKGVEITSDRREYRRGETVNLRVRFLDQKLAPPQDDGVVLLLERQGHRTQRITLRRGTAGGMFQVELPSAAVGRYRARLATPVLDVQVASADFEVVAPPGEFQRIQLDAAQLQRAAERTGGRYYTFDDAHRLLEDLPPGRQVPIESLPPKPLWNRWPLLLLFLTLLAGEWILRKAGGMV